MYRQGDVLVVPIAEIPADAEKVDDNKDIILAYGEVTGHAHAIRAGAAMFRDDGLQTWLQVDEGGALLVHEEHSAITLPPGNYRVVIQREYSPIAIQNVAD